MSNVHSNGASESKSVDNHHHLITHPNNFPFQTEYEETEEYETDEDYDDGDLNGSNIPNSNGIFCMYDLCQNQYRLVINSLCSSYFTTNNCVEGDRN